jgi:hypothetical protein
MLNAQSILVVKLMNRKVEKIHTNTGKMGRKMKFKVYI